MMGGGDSVGVLYSPQRTGAVYEHAKDVGSKMGINIVPIPFEDSGSLDDQLRTRLRGADTVWAVPDPEAYAPDNFDRMVETTLQLKRSLLSYSEKFVERGALFSVSVDYPTVGRQVAGIALDVLQHGSQTKDVGIVDPIGTRWVVNAHTMRSLGLEIPEFVQQQFDRVIEDDDSSR
jgi:putative ABC transport system substrate-binding protein